MPGVWQHVRSERKAASIGDGDQEQQTEELLFFPEGAGRHFGRPTDDMRRFIVIDEHVTCWLRGALMPHSTFWPGSIEHRWAEGRNPSRLLWDRHRLPPPPASHNLNLIWFDLLSEKCVRKFLTLWAGGFRNPQLVGSFCARFLPFRASSCDGVWGFLEACLTGKTHLLTPW